MPDVKISELPAGVATSNAIIPATNAAGTVTQKITVGSILSLVPAGATGPAGPQGEPGAAGADGADGADAFAFIPNKSNPGYLAGEIVFYSGGYWVANLNNDGIAPPGNYGAGDYWSPYSFLGPQGEPGSAGPAGPEGAPGPVGATGPAGPAGPAGPTGPAGPAGEPGADGADGADGQDGSPLPTVVSLTYASTLATDAAAGDIFDVTLAGDVTLDNPTNATNGQTLRWRIAQDATGGRTVTLGNKFALPAGVPALEFSSAADKVDILAATYHSASDRWFVVALVAGY